MGKYRKITKAEFCEKTHTSEDCWIFEPDKIGKKPLFFEAENGEVYFDNDQDRVYKFKKMDKYGEVWMTEKPYGIKKWDIYGTWTQLD